MSIFFANFENKSISFSKFRFNFCRCQYAFFFKHIAFDQSRTMGISKVTSKWENIFLALYQVGTDFFRSCLIFVGSSPTWGDIFFLKSDIKWAFSSLESYVINLNGQNNLKTQKNIQEIAHWPCILMIAGSNSGLGTIFFSLEAVWPLIFITWFSNVLEYMKKPI